MLGPKLGFAAIKNSGPGTALRVDLVLSFDPPAERWPGMNLDRGTVIRAKGQYEDVYEYAYSLDESNRYSCAVGASY
jgi:hypothetical protein